ncbi:uncharacterized protein LOC118647278 [Monomorium pharaonis]|uniref:uncharacterized protein LOC118647278 n=1 Tax=Monomorium pharaonis TaxID=307658 RepID=UPI001746C241|nr:uncharacterized protein LOC118647278 [Monomorium pharaonis]
MFSVTYFQLIACRTAKFPQTFCRSQTRSDDANNSDSERETRDHSLWTSLQVDKIWSRVHDACKNVVKLAATTVGRVVRDTPKSERSQKSLVEVADATLVESSISCDEICGETCRKNLMRSKTAKKTEAHQERTIGDVGKYPRNAEAAWRKNSRIIASSSLRRDTRERAYRNAEKEKDEESCVICNGTILI